MFLRKLRTVYCVVLYLLPVIGSLSLKPPAEEIQNKYLCPNPVLSTASKLLPYELTKIQPIRLQPRPRSTNTFSRFFRPCTYVEDHSLNPQDHDTNSNGTFIKIKAISLNVNPWNFSTATEECTKFIMFRSWSEYGNGYPVMCGRENFDQNQGPWGHPMILYYRITEQGMSFPLFHQNVEPMGLSASSSSSSSGTGSSRDHHSQQHKQLLELKYMLIYYSIRDQDGKTNSCRLQQYLLNPQQDACPSWHSTSSPICGEYQCGELDSLYQKSMGVLIGEAADFQQQRYVIVKSKTQERYRVRNFLRQKFVPIVFLVILICGYKTYMKAGYRLHEHQLPVSETRLSRFNQRHSHLHHARDPFRDIYFDYSRGAGDENNIPLGLHIPYEPANSDVDARRGPGPQNPTSQDDPQRKYLDPPPPYETLFPPSYNELFYPSLPPPPSPSDPLTSETNLITPIAVDNFKNLRV